MTPTSAPLKLTEEQVAGLLFKVQCSHPWSVITCVDIAADWRTLRAACDENHAKIARLKEEHESELDHFNDWCAEQRQEGYARGEEQAWEDAESRIKAATDRATRAEARLAAMATVTEALAAALETISEEHDAGRHDGQYEACPANDADTMFAVARAALEAFVANKTAGEK